MRIEEQHKLVLKVLVSMKTCIDANDTYCLINGDSFNLNLHAGICWHVLVHTPMSEYSGIGRDFLQPAFDYMGLDHIYPVESQFMHDRRKCANMHTAMRNLYNTESQFGRARIKLLEDLIQYYTERS